MRKTLLVAMAAMLVLAFALPASARSENAPTKIESLIWADGDQYGTILLGSLKAKPQNAHSFDSLYVFPEGEQAPVAEAAHGRDYNGGRWLPTPVTWADGVDPYVLTSEDAVQEAAAAGHVMIGMPMYDGAFLCPLIP